MTDRKDYQPEYDSRSEVKASKREYQQRPDVKARKKKYLQRPDVKEKRRLWSKEYYQQFEVKARIKEYNQSPEVIANRRELQKIYYHKPKNKARQREYERKPEVVAKRKEYYQRPEVKKRRTEYNMIYRQRPEVKARNREYSKLPAIREYHRMYRKTKMETDPIFVLQNRLRDSLRQALFRYTVTGKVVSSRTYGINYEECIEKLVNTLPEDLKNDWENNRSKYHIDHIKPLKLFDLEDPEQVKEAFAPENLQWLTATENVTKSAKWDGVV